VLFWRSCAAVSLDAAYAATLGHPVRATEWLLSALLVASVVLGIQAVGVVLMSALVVAPAVAARAWTDRLHRLVPLAAMIGAACGMAGTLVSHELATPTGPAIVLVATAVALLSLLKKARAA
jgi:manganese/zinc/iron transport system permease protein